MSKQAPVVPAAFTVKNIAMAAATIFRMYDFSAKDATVRVYGNRDRDGVKVSFAEEMPTGQAGFSQSRVRCAFTIWTAEKVPDGTENWELWSLEARTWDQDGTPVVNVILEVTYDHHDGGSNGVDRRYVASQDGTKIKLVPLGQ